jgi:chromosome segregation protein
VTTPTSQAVADDTPNDVVGGRVLVGIQMINISRLSTHPIPLTTNGLITIAGQGPTDSNGAGKSSFIAGLSLLHADDQWRLQSGAQAAAELLFTAELAGQEAVHANADRGYIIGVFAPPTADTVAELEAAVLTVWLRVNRQSPHLELRWTPRLHIPYGETENERAAGAEGLWNALPKGGRRTDVRANRLAKTLYGKDTVRCVSFLSTSVRASPTANLLAQPLNELSPERIFDAIGALTGLTGELEQEQKARAKEHQDAKTEDEVSRSPSPATPPPWVPVRLPEPHRRRGPDLGGSAGWCGSARSPR